MKKLILAILIVTGATIVTAQLQQQQPKQYPASLTIDEWNFVIQQVNDSPTPGAVRNQIVNKLSTQLSTLIQADIQKQPKQDSTKKKP